MTYKVPIDRYVLDNMLTPDSIEDIETFLNKHKAPTLHITIDVKATFQPDLSKVIVLSCKDVTEYNDFVEQSIENNAGDSEPMFVYSKESSTKLFKQFLEKKLTREQLLNALMENAEKYIPLY